MACVAFEDVVDKSQHAQCCSLHTELGPAVCSAQASRGLWPKLEPPLVRRGVGLASVRMRLWRGGECECKCVNVIGTH
jgi:hypothetical protein